MQIVPYRKKHPDWIGYYLWLYWTNQKLIIIKILKKENNEWKSYYLFQFVSSWSLPLLESSKDWKAKLLHFWKLGHHCLQLYGLLHHQVRCCTRICYHHCVSVEWPSELLTSSEVVSYYIRSSYFCWHLMQCIIEMIEDIPIRLGFYHRKYNLCHLR